MSCGCSQKKKTEFVVTTKDGNTMTADNRHQALALVRQHGGQWKEVPVARK